MENVELKSTLFALRSHVLPRSRFAYSATIIVASERLATKQLETIRDRELRERSPLSFSFSSSQFS
jgi:hypothetical protein